MPKVNIDAKDFLLEKELSFASIYLHKDGDILLVRYKESTLMDYNRAKEIIEEVYPYVSNGVSLGISDSRAEYHHTTPEARVLLSNNKSLKHYKAHAVLVNSLPVRILTNFFIHFNKPIVPFKMFSEMDEAIDWLRFEQIED